VDDEGDIPTSYERLCVAAGALLANAGVMAAAMPQMPEGVQAGFKERLDEIIDELHTHIEAIQLFGEAYDEPEPS
jgi:hypothetical protein